MSALKLAVASLLPAILLPFGVFSFFKNFLVLERMKRAEFLSTNFSVEPNSAHREDFRIKVDIVHVPDDDCQKGKHRLIAMDNDKNIMNP